MFVILFFIVAKLREQPKCPSTNKWINNIWHTCAVEYYSTMKELIHATTQKNPENIVLSVKNQTQKATHCVIPFT